ncbi:MAG TPA: nuclear transport factor 2 family protein [Thermoanaerobaculia bacterium]|jgi:ketosteroid isomerase-like protein|nr:nuclear transport factor 2 family protein [Thermoanaerobaculia bacterium]
MTTPHAAKKLAFAVAALLLGAGAVAPTTPAPVASQSDRAALVEQVKATETAFAKTMADRDHAAFTSFLSSEAIFFSGPEPLRGKEKVAAWWKRFYEGKEAPFSWRPEQVEVLDSGALALSSGPVFDPTGRQTGTFTSIWRLEAPGTWRIIFDKGCEVCAPPAP